jgi:hypothetical protein
MKGGVTSGLVYPGAIAALANQYRLRNIGGTSAGAIAAVAAAAMEYGLQTGNPVDPRITLANLPRNVLAQRTDQGSTRLDAMFSGDVGTSAILDAVKATLSGNPGKLLGLALPVFYGSRLFKALIQMIMVSVLQALACGGLAGWAVHVRPTNPVFDAAVVMTIFMASLVGALGLNFQAFRYRPPVALEDVDPLFRPIIDNGLGLSTGKTDLQQTINQQSIPALIPWLHQTIQSLAGLPDDTADDVLTFGKLWNLGTHPEPSSLDPREIDLVLVCSDLNRLQSASFPFLPDNQRLFYDPAAWERLFPKPVMDALATKSWAVRDHNAMPDNLGYGCGDLCEALHDHGDLSQRLQLMPKGRDIPILVAARASMGFPGLFTPVPMWLLRWEGEPKTPNQRRALLSRVYLSDGGLTSNFPIHLFDAVVPSRPTFAINLLYPGDDLSIEEFQRKPSTNSDAAPPAPVNVRTVGGTSEPVAMAVWDDLMMPFDNKDQVKFYKGPASGGALSQLLGLMVRVAETSRTWGDVHLFNQTGTRDRTLHIRLTGEEGGFNFNMSPETIASIDWKGTQAGTVLACRFLKLGATDPLQDYQTPKLGWLNHRTVRINGMLAAHDLLAARFHNGWQPPPPPKPQRDDPPLSSLVTDPHLKKIAAQLDAIGALPTPNPDPLTSQVAPLNLFRLRPAGHDPKDIRRP